VWHLTTNKRIAGIAKFLLKMYKTTRDKKYLEYAEDATRWIINTRIKC
jgi:rhamnogalacturonyl hydrolase YesR